MKRIAILITLLLLPVSALRTDEIHPKWELVGTHTGRRTFIVNALSFGIPPNIVMNGQATVTILP